MSFKRIVILAGKWDTTPIFYHFANTQWGVTQVLLEEGVPRSTFLKKRVKKLGYLEVSGQVLFQALIGKPLARFSKQRIRNILDAYQLKADPIPEEMITEVGSVNSDTCLKALQDLKPDLVLVHGTRIISKKILSAINAPFINIHAGITPRYRGSHGAYWALYNNDSENCGVTVHLVDAGIDTGGVLAQARIPLKKEDNFVTYPYLQLAEGLQLLREVVPAMARGERNEIANSLSSALWHHPTLWGYLWKWATKGVK